VEALEGLLGGHLQAPTAPILRKPSTVRLRKGFPMSMTTSILGDLRDPEKPPRGILPGSGSGSGRSAV
jgi:hypothetical protein